MSGWENFFVAQAGASAALAGLVFVGLSLNLAKIIAIPALPYRALEALVALLTVLFISSLLLVPEQPRAAIGWEMLGAGCVTMLSLAVLHARGLQRTEAQYRRHAFRGIAIHQVSALPLVVGGALLLAGIGAGIYWVVPGVLLLISSAMLDAWVLLVEINR